MLSILSNQVCTILTHGIFQDGYTSYIESTCGTYKERYSFTKLEY